MGGIDCNKKDFFSVQIFSKHGFLEKQLGDVHGRFDKKRGAQFVHLNGQTLTLFVQEAPTLYFRTIRKTSSAHMKVLDIPDVVPLLYLPLLFPSDYLFNLFLHHYLTRHRQLK